MSAKGQTVGRDGDHEWHYNPRVAVPDFASYALKRQPVNESVKRAVRVDSDLRYGAHDRRRLDIYHAAAIPVARPPHVHLFFHGGFWRAQDKEGYAFVAAQLVKRGVTVVVPNYELCPDSTLDGVVDSAMAAFRWTLENVPLSGRNGISISGHSAGAHLCAEVVASKRCAEALAGGQLSGSVLVSGVFDPEPARHTTINEQLHLDAEIAARHNMNSFPPKTVCPTWLFAGGQESWRWIDQTFDHSRHLRRNGHDCDVRVLPGLNHFSILEQYLDPASPVVQAVLSAAGKGEHRDGPP